MERGYQYNYSEIWKETYDTRLREKKARTMVAILESGLDKPLSELSAIDVGGSAGIIANYLSDHFARVVGIDLDDAAVDHARGAFKKDNLDFHVADALSLPFPDDSFGVVICSQVYEHVKDPAKMFDEIFRVLAPGGVCYLSASNRLMWNEPHYDLPLLSVMPRPCAHVYMKLAGKGDFYYEKHLSYWGLKSLVERFQVIDYTVKAVCEPGKFGTDYMVKPNSLKTKGAKFVLKYLYWAFPRYLWLLKKPCESEI